MQKFDVYLNRRLTEIDVIITQLVQRDAFSMYDWLYLDCAMDMFEMRKHLEAYSSLLLDVNINDLLEKVHEIIYSDLYLNVDVALLNRMISGGEAELVLSASEIDTLEKSFTSGKSFLEISVDTLDYYIAHSFGSVEFDMILSVSELNTFKYGMESFEEFLELLSEIDFASLKKTDFAECLMYLDVPSTNIFYLLTTGGKSATYLNANPISKYVLKKVLHNVFCNTYLSATSEKIFELMKFFDIGNSLELIADMADVLVQFIESQTDMVLDCEANAGLKRYRLLYEMDELSLDDIDDMTLQELDYVIITE